jgi:hypothetical protein
VPSETELFAAFESLGCAASPEGSSERKISSLADLADLSGDSSLEDALGLLPSSEDADRIVAKCLSERDDASMTQARTSMHSEDEELPFELHASLLCSGEAEDDDNDDDEAEEEITEVMATVTVNEGGPNSKAEAQCVLVDEVDGVELHLSDEFSTGYKCVYKVGRCYSVQMGTGEETISTPGFKTAIDAAAFYARLNPELEKQECEQEELIAQLAPLPEPASKPLLAAKPVAYAVGQRVLVPATLWPTYACSEHGGEGWEAKVVRSTAETATISFTCAYCRETGKEFEDVTLRSEVLKTLPNVGPKVPECKKTKTAVSWVVGADGELASPPPEPDEQGTKPRKATKMVRCSSCSACKRSDCGKCVHCLE